MSRYFKGQKERWRREDIPPIATEGEHRGDLSRRFRPLFGCKTISGSPAWCPPIQAYLAFWEVHWAVVWRIRIRPHCVSVGVLTNRLWRTWTRIFAVARKSSKKLLVKFQGIYSCKMETWYVQVPENHNMPLERHLWWGSVSRKLKYPRMIIVIELTNHSFETRQFELKTLQQRATNGRDTSREKQPYSYMYRATAYRR